MLQSDACRMRVMWDDENAYISQAQLSHSTLFIESCPDENYQTLVLNVMLQNVINISVQFVSNFKRLSLKVINGGV